jgi:DNA-binding transcriptional ArsR family regulator
VSALLDGRSTVLYYTARLFNEMVSSTAPDRLSTTLAALADPTRRAILARLTSGETSVTELAKPFSMTLPAVSKHLKVLERAGLIARGRSAQWRPCRLDAEPMREVAEWVQGYRRFWDGSFDRLDDYLNAVQAKEKKRDRKR